MREGVDAVRQVKSADGRGEEVRDGVVELGGVFTGAYAGPRATIRSNKDDITFLRPQQPYYQPNPSPKSHMAKVRFFDVFGMGKARAYGQRSVYFAA